MTTLQKPTKSTLNNYIKLFDTEYSRTEAYLFDLFQKYFPDNNSPEQVMIKVFAINLLYKTYIRWLPAVVTHILQCDIDNMLRNNDINAVHVLTPVKFKTKTKHLKSFATKYCSFHKPDIFPLFDSNASYALYKYNKIYKFSPHVTRTSLLSYENYIETINSFRTYFNIENYNYKNIDKYLWKYGKELLDK